MAIRSPCECGYVYFAPNQEAGTSIVCPGCGNQLPVPVESDAGNGDDDDPYGLSNSPRVPSESIGLGPPMQLDSVSDISLNLTEGTENETDSDPVEDSIDDANGSDDSESGISIVDDAPHVEPSLDESSGAEDNSPVTASLVDDPAVCPSCGSSLSSRSVVCVHCGYDRRSGRRLHTEAGSEDLAQAEAELDEEVSQEEAALAEGLSKKTLSIALGVLGLFMLISLVLGKYSILLAGLLLVPGGAILAVMHAMGGGEIKTVVLGVVLSFIGVLLFCCSGVILFST